MRCSNAPITKSAGTAIAFLMLAVSTPGAIAAPAQVGGESPAVRAGVPSGRESQCITEHEYERIKTAGRHTWTMWKVKRVVGFRGWTYVWKHGGKVRFWDHCKKPRLKAYVHFGKLRHADWKCDKKWDWAGPAGTCEGLFGRSVRVATAGR